MATDTPAIPPSLATVAGVSGDDGQNFAALRDDFTRLRGEELKVALGELGTRAAQALSVAQQSLGDRAVERKRVLDAFKTAAVRRQLDAVPTLKAQAELLVTAEAKAAAEDKKTNAMLVLFDRISSAALPRK